MKQLSTIQLLLILIAIIIFIPPILVNIHIIDWFSYGKANEIGDTLGGITAPFINGLAALLVFITFKEQIKANKLLQEQVYIQHIQEQINRLEDDFLNISEMKDKLSKEINESIMSRKRILGSEPPYYIDINEDHLNKIMYSTTVFNQILEMIKNLDSDKVFFENKLSILFKIIYKKNYSDIIETFEYAQKHRHISKAYMEVIITEMKKLEAYFSV